MANSSSSLSNVVSSLVRAQMGSSIPENTLDEELDRRVAELILKEARKGEARYGKTGSYSPQPVGANAAKTNKRFLTSIIRSTDEHNKTILRAQAEAANEVKGQREKEEREERMRRAQEAVTARLGTTSSSRLLREYEEHGRRDDSREGSERHHSTRPGKRRRERHSDSGSESERTRKRPKRDEEKERQRSTSPRPQKDRESRREREHGDEKRSSHQSNRDDKGKDDRERQNHHKSRHLSRSRSPTRERYRRRDEEGSKSSSSNRHHSSRAVRDHSGSHPKDKSEPKALKVPEVDARRVAKGSNAPSTSKSSLKDTASDADVRATESEQEIGPFPASIDHSPKQYSSKMDKYFTEDYDPRLDVTTSLTAMDGFIPAGAFDNWDMMLQVVRQRREEKEERKRLEKLHRGNSSTKSKKEKSAPSKGDAETVDLLGIQYTKRGGVREWDEGKR